VYFNLAEWFMLISKTCLWDEISFTEVVPSVSREYAEMMQIRLMSLHEICIFRWHTIHKNQLM